MQDTLETEKQDGTLTISISGGFNAGLLHRFRDVFDDIDSSSKNIVLDLSATEYIDSAALGLMIHIRKRLDRKVVKHIRIINCNARIRKVFKTMRFEDMFEIDMM